MILIWLVVTVFMLFAFVILRGAPFLISHRSAIEDGLDALDLRPGQTLIDLGSGDGAVLKAAAERKLKVIGYELNPLLVVYSRFRLRKYDDVKIHFGDYMKSELPPADGLYLFLLPRYMKPINDYLKRNTHKRLKVVSYATPIPGAKLKKEVNGIHLYHY